MKKESFQAHNIKFILRVTRCVNGIVNCDKFFFLSSIAIKCEAMMIDRNAKGRGWDRNLVNESVQQSGRRFFIA